METDFCVCVSVPVLYSGLLCEMCKIEREKNESGRRKGLTCEEEQKRQCLRERAWLGFAAGAMAEQRNQKQILKGTPSVFFLSVCVSVDRSLRLCVLLSLSLSLYVVLCFTLPQTLMFTYTMPNYVSLQQLGNVYASVLCWMLWLHRKEKPLQERRRKSRVTMW